MYDYLIGKITTITPNYLVLEVAGVGYLLNVANPYAYSARQGESVQLYVHQVVREDALTLYGFTDAHEKGLFLRLIAVTGIGPKSALAIIAADDNAGLVAAIDQGDVKYLTKFPGVGNKTASQMVLDLKGKFVSADATASLPSADSPLDEALEALTALGYKSAELKRVEKSLSSLTEALSTEAYIKRALRLLIK